jgi:orotidine-5'-phosphate decarboxylase
VSIDKLQEKIRKLKNPSMVDFSIPFDCIPDSVKEQESNNVAAYARFCRELLVGLKECVPAVRFSFNAFAMLGEEGLRTLTSLLREAKNLEYYVLLDGPGIISPWDAQQAAECFHGTDDYPCDGLMIQPYIGSDGVKPFLPFCKDADKDLFVVVRSANKSARELQDLLTGSRHVHSAAADMVNRLGEGIYGNCGYSKVAGVASAGEANTLRTLRGAYNRMFLLVDGVDYPGANFKNCSNAFDRFGHGAAVCAGMSVLGAWKEAESDGSDFVFQAQQSAERMKKNLIRYITVL